MDKKTREEYLMNWKDGLWIQIRQKEDAIWRFISFYSASVIVLLGLLINNQEWIIGIHKYILMGTLLIISIIGILIILDANFWLNHNLHLIGNVEREMLGSEELNHIIPKAYSLPRFVISKSYSIHLLLMFLTIIPVIVISIIDAYKNITEPYLIFFAWLLSFLWLLVYYRYHEYQIVFWDAVCLSRGTGYKEFLLDSYKNKVSLFVERVFCYGYWYSYFLILLFNSYLIVNFTNIEFVVNTIELFEKKAITLFILLLLLIFQFFTIKRMRYLRGQPTKNPKQQLKKFINIGRCIFVVDRIKHLILLVVNLLLLCALLFN